MWNLVPVPCSEPGVRYEARVVIERHPRLTSCLIVFACALSEELRDDELIVSLDHCSSGRHRYPNEWAPRPARQSDGMQPKRRERAMQLTPAQVKQIGRASCRKE